MKRFIQRFADKITGVLSGFDRLVFRGGLRPLTYTGGMKRLLWQRQLWIGDFGDYAQGVTEKLKEATSEWVRQQQRPLIYLSSSKASKDTLARKVAEKDGVREGLIAVLSCVEPCLSYEVYRNREKKRLELRPRWTRCLFFYHYFIDPEFGFMNGRIQTWLPFNIQLCVNGREWLSRRMDEAGIGYRRLENKFVWIEDVEEAQKLMDRQLKTPWPQMLERLAGMLNRAHRDIFEGFDVGYYWTGYQTEWATDVMFKDLSELARIYPALVMHAMRFSSGEVMRFLGRKVNGNFLGEIRSEFKKRPEGIVVKHRVGQNSVKMYNVPGVLRVETTIHDVKDFRVFRRKENDPSGEQAWRPLRKGVADLHRRAEVSGASNDRYLDALAAVDSSQPLGELVCGICKPVVWKGKRIRALRPWSTEDSELFRAVSRGEFSVNGFRNRDLQALLFRDLPSSTEEKRRRSARVSRLLRMLRAHHLIRKVPSTYRYVLTPKGRDIFAAVLISQGVTPEQLYRAAA